MVSAPELRPGQRICRLDSWVCNGLSITSGGSPKLLIEDLVLDSGRGVKATAKPPGRGE